MYEPGHARATCVYIYIYIYIYVRPVGGTAVRAAADESAARASLPPFTPVFTLSRPAQCLELPPDSEPERPGARKGYPGPRRSTDVERHRRAPTHHNSTPSRAQSAGQGGQNAPATRRDSPPPGTPGPKGHRSIRRSIPHVDFRTDRPGGGIQNRATTGLPNEKGSSRELKTCSGLR